MKEAPPTRKEFEIARERSRDNDSYGEDAYQVCQWYRGQMFLRARAERWLSQYRTIQELAK
jgi:hypothetical protein